MVKLQKLLLETLDEGFKYFKELKANPGKMLVIITAVMIEKALIDTLSGARIKFLKNDSFSTLINICRREFPSGHTDDTRKLDDIWDLVDNIRLMRNAAAHEINPDVKVENIVKKIPREILSGDFLSTNFAALKSSEDVNMFMFVLFDAYSSVCVHLRMMTIYKDDDELRDEFVQLFEGVFEEFRKSEEYEELKANGLID